MSRQRWLTKEEMAQSRAEREATEAARSDKEKALEKKLSYWESCRSEIWQIHDEAKAAGASNPSELKTLTLLQEAHEAASEAVEKMSADLQYERVNSSQGQ